MGFNLKRIAKKILGSSKRKKLTKAQAAQANESSKDGAEIMPRGGMKPAKEQTQGGKSKPQQQPQQQPTQGGKSKPQQQPKGGITRSSRKPLAFVGGQKAARLSKMKSTGGGAIEAAMKLERDRALKKRDEEEEKTTPLKNGGAVRKYKDGGSVRGMGAATRGGKFKGCL